MKTIYIFSFFLFIIILTYLLYNYRCYLLKECMDDYESSKPSIEVLYKDRSGIEISNLGNYGRCLIIEDEIQLCEKDEHIYHEMIVHLPVMYLKRPIKNVVIVGGGDLMTLREVMKYYSIEKVFMLELDQTIVDLCEKHFNESKYEDDSRVEIKYGDANDTINEIMKKYYGEIDLVIVDTTEDNTNNTSVDSEKFFMKCFDLLNYNGILVKNGAFFKNMFEDFDKKYTISYNADIPYFQERYVFTIASNQENNIKERKINKEQWRDYEIDVKYYKPTNHNKYLIYESYNDIEKDDM